MTPGAWEALAAGFGLMHTDVWMNGEECYEAIDHFQLNYLPTRTLNRSGEDYAHLLALAKACFTLDMEIVVDGNPRVVEAMERELQAWAMGQGIRMQRRLREVRDPDKFVS